MPASNQTIGSSRAATDRSIRALAFSGAFVIFGLLGGFVTWSALTDVSGAVIAPGHIAVESNARKVQHPEASPRSR
jgi:HlyD family secretion protein